MINEFTLKADEALTAFSLDRVFDVIFPIGAASASKTTLSINTIEPPISSQNRPSFWLASVCWHCKVAPYQVELHSEAERLVKPATLKFRFDLDALTNQLQTNWGLNPGAVEFNPTLQKEGENLAIYQWQMGINAWKRLPSEILRDDTGKLDFGKICDIDTSRKHKRSKIATLSYSCRFKPHAGRKMGNPFP